MAEGQINDCSIDMQHAMMTAKQASHMQNSQAQSSVSQSTDHTSNDHVAKDSGSCTPTKSERDSDSNEALDSGNGKPTTTGKEEAGGSQAAQEGTKVSEKRGIKRRLLTLIMFMESIIFMCAMGLLIASLSVDRLNNSMLWDFGIWKWCLLTISILCGRLIAFLLTKALLFLLWIFWLDERVLYFAYGVRKSFMFMIWVGLVTLAWGLLTRLGPKRREDVSKILHDVTRGLIGCLIGAMLWLFKTLLVKCVGSLHAKKLFDKIKEAIRLREALIALSNSERGTDKTSNSDKEKGSVLDHVRSFGRLCFTQDIKNIDFENQNLELISSWREKVRRALLSNLGIDKSADSVSLKTMIELIRAIRGKKLIPFIYIPEDTTTTNNNNIAADDKTTKETERKVVSEQRISGDQEGANSVAKQNSNDVAKKKKVAAEITDEKGARTAAKVIFTAIAGSEESKYVDLKKLLEFVKDEKVKLEHIEGLADKKAVKTEGKQTAGCEQTNTGEKHIKRSAFETWVVDIYRDHDSLNSTLQHSKTAIDELNVIASVIVLIVIIIVWLLFMGFLTTKLLVFVSSQILLVVFIFGNTVKTVFEAVIFVFLVHPFDVGDRCVVGGVQMVVEEMNILTTTFLRYDGEKIYYPNSVLAFKPISNFYRSPQSMTDSVEFAIGVNTKDKQIKKLRQRIKEYLELHERRWKADHFWQFKEIEDVNKMKVVLYVTHTINFQNLRRRLKRRSKLVVELKRNLRNLHIEYHLLPQKVELIKKLDPQHWQEAAAA